MAVAENCPKSKRVLLGRVSRAGQEGLTMNSEKSPCGAPVHVTVCPLRMVGNPQLPSALCPVGLTR